MVGPQRASAAGKSKFLGRMSTVAGEKRVPFGATTFLRKAGEGTAIASYRKGQVFFAQADTADAIFYIQKGKLTVVSDNGKEAVSALLGVGDFLGEGCLAGKQLRLTARLYDWRRQP
jgi:CRP/FNR family cyclic AMP-dependent transcriptional regulator